MIGRRAFWIFLFAAQFGLAGCQTDFGTGTWTEPGQRQASMVFESHNQQQLSATTGDVLPWYAARHDVLPRVEAGYVGPTLIHTHRRTWDCTAV